MVTVFGTADATCWSRVIDPLTSGSSQSMDPDGIDVSSRDERIRTP